MHLHPDWREVRDGLFVTRPKASPMSQEILDHYKNDLEAMLDADKKHYRKLKKVLGPLADVKFGSVADIGGGFPKLATLLNIRGPLVSFDWHAELYRHYQDRFDVRFPHDFEVHYAKQLITDRHFKPHADLAIYCHILEHLDSKQIPKLLSRVDARHCVVYGPNISTADSDDWIHYRAPDHKTLMKLENMCMVLGWARYKVKYTRAFNSDYLVYGERV